MMNDYILKTVAMDVVQREGILPFLEVVAANPHLSVVNQAMLYFQRPTAGFVCGKKAWEAMGKEVKKEATPIVLYLPEVKKLDDQYESSYEPVNVYEEKDVIPDPSKESHSGTTRGMDDGDRIARILEVTGATTELVEREVMRGPGEHGFYDEKRNVFYLERGMDREVHNKVMLDLFIRHMIGILGYKDKLLFPAVKYVVCSRFRLSQDVGAPLFTKLDFYDEEQKTVYLKELNLVVTEVLQILDDRHLTFDETAFVNGILETAEQGEAIVAFENASTHITDEMLAAGLRRFADKLRYAEEGYVAELYYKRMKRQVYSYPPQPVFIDEKRYWNERSRL